MAIDYQRKNRGARVDSVDASANPVSGVDQARSTPPEISDVRASLLSALCDSWGDTVYENQRGAIIVPMFGATACFVEPSLTQDKRLRVNVRSPIALEVPPSPGLFELIARNATNFNFGALSLCDLEGVLSIEFDYAVLGESLHPDDLNYVVGVVGRTASSLVTELCDRFGGRPLILP